MKNDKKFKTKLEKASDLLSKDKYEEALEIFMQLDKQRPNNVHILIGIAQCFSELDRVDEALDILDTILTEYPFLDMAVLFKAQILQYENRVQEAISFLENKIWGGFKDPEGYALLGELYQMDDKPILAISAFKNALSSPSLLNRRAVTINLADSYTKIGNYKIAFETYDELLNSNPDDAVVLYSKAMALKEKNDLSECLKILKRVTLLYSEFLVAWQSLGELYQELGADDKARECFDKVNELNAKQNK